MGIFIAIEGPDGVGKSTVAKLLRDHMELNHMLRGTALTAEPTGERIGRLARDVLQGGAHPELKAMLFSADRADHVRRQILPFLGAGMNVVSDRFDLSTMVYQLADYELRGESGDPAWLRALVPPALREIVPDVTIVLDAPFEVLEKQLRARGGALERPEQGEMQRIVYALYQLAHTLLPGRKVLRVSAVGDLEEVTRRCMVAVSEARTPMRDWAIVASRLA